MPEQNTYLAQVVHQRDQARAELAALHEGEEPHLDERAVATPAQWIWHWNRATPARRLEVITEMKDMLDRADGCFMGFHEGQIADLRQRLADEHRTSADRAAELYKVRQLLRAAEDELAVHRQRAATRPVETRPLAEPELTVRMMTPPLPACPDCQMPRHGGYTCDEATALGIILRKAFDEAYEQMKEPHLGAPFTGPDHQMDNNNAEDTSCSQT